MNFKVKDKKTWKAIKVHFDWLKKYKTREKPFTPEPQAKRKTTIKEQKNTNWNSSNDGDIIEIESSTDTESNQSEAEDAIDSQTATNDTSENEAKESEQETSKGKEEAQNVAEGGDATSSKPTEYNGKKQQKEKFQNQKKSHRNLSVKQKVLKKRLIVIPGHQKWLQGLAAD